MFSRHGRERANTLHNQMPDLCLPSLPPPAIRIPCVPKDALKSKVISGEIPPLI